MDIYIMHHWKLLAKFLRRLGACPVIIAGESKDHEIAVT